MNVISGRCKYRKDFTCYRTEWNHCRQPSRYRASATASSSTPGSPMLMAAVEALFKFEPFFAAATRGARSTIIKRAEAIGIDWSGVMKSFKAIDWDSKIMDVENTSVQYPLYYKKPFHAYKQGNLCWDAALEVSMAAKSVHALVMDPEGKKLDAEGDHNLRSNYSSCTHACLGRLGKDSGSIRDILDIGAASGLSSLELLRAFPGSKVIALDLSPHFLAVGRYLQQERQMNDGTEESMVFIHGLGEASGLPDRSVDLVSICLVFHELPQDAARAMIREAHRVLRPGGAIAIMEMDPTTGPFQRILSNPFAYTAFKSTEPWLQDYIALDMDAALVAGGFSQPLKMNNTPRHKTVVALKV